MMTEPSYSSNSVIVSFLLVLTSFAHAYSIDATDMMAASDSGSTYTTATTNGKMATENVKELRVSVNQEAQAIDVHPAAEETHVTEAIGTSASSAPQVTKREGNDIWSINIASLGNKDTANRFVIRARKKGIDATQKPVWVEGRKYWRVSVKGFASPAEARSHASQVKSQLGLNEVWIGKDSG
jgi:cell division septation protein DedD